CSLRTSKPPGTIVRFWPSTKPRMRNSSRTAMIAGAFRETGSAKPRRYVRPASCARATRGHPVATPPRTLMTSRRLMPTIGFLLAPWDHQHLPDPAHSVGLLQAQRGSGRPASPWGSPEMSRCCRQLMRRPCRPYQSGERPATAEVHGNAHGELLVKREKLGY